METTRVSSAADHREPSGCGSCVWLMDLPPLELSLALSGFWSLARRVQVDLNQTFPSRLLPPIGPRQRGENGDEIPVGHILLVDQLLIVMDHKARVITHAPMTRGQ